MMTLCMRVSYYKLQKANERDGGRGLLAGGVFFPTVRRKNGKGRKGKREAVATTPKRIFLSERSS